MNEYPQTVELDGVTYRIVPGEATGTYYAVPVPQHPDPADLLIEYAYGEWEGFKEEPRRSLDRSFRAERGRRLVLPVRAVGKAQRWIQLSQRVR